MRWPLSLSIPTHPGDFNQALMELGATVCLPRNPLPGVPAGCRLQNPRRTQDPGPLPHAQPRSRPRALGPHRHPAPARHDREVLLEQRPPRSPSCLACGNCPLCEIRRAASKTCCMTIRHAIMQVNYYVRIRTVFEDDMEASDRSVASGAGFRSARRRPWRLPGWRARCSPARAPFAGTARSTLPGHQRMDVL